VFFGSSARRRVPAWGNANDNVANTNMPVRHPLADFGRFMLFLGAMVVATGPRVISGLLPDPGRPSVCYTLARRTVRRNGIALIDRRQQG
jgi:hypothetical protein